MPRFENQPNGSRKTTVHKSEINPQPTANQSAAKERTKEYCPKPLYDFRITVHNRTVTVSGLCGDEHIAIYDTSGRLYTSADNRTGEYSATLPAPGIYIVAVDGMRKKFVVK